MKEVDQDPYVCPDIESLSGILEDFPECHERDCLEKMLDLLFGDSLLNCEDELKSHIDFSECFDDDYLEKISGTDLLFEDPALDELELESYSVSGDVSSPTAPSKPESHQTDQPTGRTNPNGKRLGAPCSPCCTDDDTPSMPKRQRATGTDAGSEPGSTEMAGLSTTPPTILQLHPSIQLITIPDTPGNQTLKPSPPVIRLPLVNNYILVPAVSPPLPLQVPPLSPADGAVAPVQMSSSPPGSLSDTTSKAFSYLCTSPVPPNNEVSTCKKSPHPRFPIVPNMAQVVKDYIQESKVQMNQTCQDMDAGLKLSSHYVDVLVSKREIFCCGKKRNKSVDKEPRDLFIAGDCERQKNTLDVSQIFGRSNGDKPKCYILLLGNAGMGKTTLVKKLCYDWSRDSIPQFDFAFVLDGKALTLTKPVFSLQTLLLNLSSFAPPCSDPKAVYSQIIAAPNRVLIIFDGFDNLREYEALLQIQEKDLITSLQRDSKAQTYTVRQLYSAILQRVLLPGSTLLLSSRPRGAANQLLRRTDSCLGLCGFTLTDIERYLSQYFTDPAHRASALECLKNCRYLHLLCGNPGLCRLVCFVLEESKSLQVLPKTLTGLCHRVLHLKMEKIRNTSYSQADPQSDTSVQQPHLQISSRAQVKRRKSRANARTKRARRGRAQRKEKNATSCLSKYISEKGSGPLETEMLSQLSFLAWHGVKANSSILLAGSIIPAELKAFGRRTGLFFTYHLRTGKEPSIGEKGREGREKTRHKVKSPDSQEADTGDDHILLWANPFLQSYLAGIYLSLSRSVAERAFLQTLVFQDFTKGRRHPQREEQELMQRFAVGILFQNRTELQKLQLHTETAISNMLVRRQALITKYLEALPYGDLSPTQVLQACHYIYEASSSQCDGCTKSGSSQQCGCLAKKLPEVLTFHGVPLNPSDIFILQNILERGGAEGQSFCLDLENSGIQISGLRALLGLNNISTYRACIADVITLWEEMEQSGEEELCKKAVSKFKIHPLKATQVCHIEHLAKLVNIHLQKRLSDSQSDSFLAEGVPAVKELHMLEFELGPKNGPLAFPKLWELLPGLHNLQHLALENSKIGDSGAEELANALVSLFLLEVLDLSQNCIGDYGVKKLAATLSDLPKLQCLSLYSNMISDEGAESLAAVLPHMASLVELDVKYNKLTDVGAQSLGVSLKHCKKMKTLRMWNQCIPYGVFERLQQQDNRILCH